MTTTQTMKKFDGNRSLEEIKTKVTNWNQERYDKEGTDWITFDYISHNGDIIPVLYNVFNGRFLIRGGTPKITESSDHLDGERWYADLLDILYKS